MKKLLQVFRHGRRRVSLGVTLALLSAWMAWPAIAATVTLDYANIASVNYRSTLSIRNLTGATIAVPDFYAPFGAARQDLGGGSLVRKPVSVPPHGEFRWRYWPNISDTAEPWKEVGTGTFDLPAGLEVVVEVDDGGSILVLPPLPVISEPVQFTGIKVGDDYRAYAVITGDAVFRWYDAGAALGSGPIETASFPQAHGFLIVEAPLHATRLVVQPAVVSGARAPRAAIYHRRQSGRYEFTLPITAWTLVAATSALNVKPDFTSLHLALQRMPAGSPLRDAAEFMLDTLGGRVAGDPGLITEADRERRLAYLLRLINGDGWSLR